MNLRMLSEVLLSSRFQGLSDSPEKFDCIDCGRPQVKINSVSSILIIIVIEFARVIAFPPSIGFANIIAIKA